MDANVMPWGEPIDEYAKKLVDQVIIENMHGSNGDVVLIEKMLRKNTNPDDPPHVLRLKKLFFEILEREIPLHCPKEGAFIGWKKARISCYTCPDSGYMWRSLIGHAAWGECLVKLEIPEDALRSSAVGNKCRCSKARVLDIQKLTAFSEKIEVLEAASTFAFGKPSRRTIYSVGEMVYPDSFDLNRWKECSNGIHFFMTKEEAMNY